jgi:mandelate racemase
MSSPVLTIRSLRAVAVDVPMARPLGTSARTMRRAPFLLIDLETDEGVTGRSYLFCYIAAAAEGIARVLQEALQVVKGDRVAPLNIADKLERHFRLIGVRGIVNMALAGLDVACWDALATAAGVPLATFIRGAGSDRAVARTVRAYNSNGLSLMSPEAVADEAEELLAGGFRAVKLRLGYPSLAEDLAAVRAVRQRLPGDVGVMTDYNQALTVTEALHRGRAIDGEGLAWIEEPIRHDDYAGAATLTRELVTPIQIGENFTGPHAMEAALAVRASDYLMVDLERIGGVSGWLRASTLAAAAGVELSSHLFPEASAHVLAATPTAHWLEYVDWASPILNEPLKIVDGHAVVPDRPGIGLSWNEDAVAKYRMR